MFPFSLYNYHNHTSCCVKAAPDFLYRELDSVKVKGKNNACVIFEPIGPIEHIASEVSESLEKYNKALSLYRNRDRNTAKCEFNTLLEAQPTFKLYQLYVQCCEEMIAHPPDKDWDGSHAFTTK